jgi:hypothetical protein
LIEAKHSSPRQNAEPQRHQRRTLIKMMLYTNLQNVKVGKNPHKLKVQIRLTANQLKGSINSDAKDEEIEKFFPKIRLMSRRIKISSKKFLKKRAQNKFHDNFGTRETAKPPNEIFAFTIAFRRAGTRPLTVSELNSNRSNARSKGFRVGLDRSGNRQFRGGKFRALVFHFARRRFAAQSGLLRSQ